MIRLVWRHGAVQKVLLQEAARWASGNLREGLRYVVNSTFSERTSLFFFSFACVIRDVGVARIFFFCYCFLAKDWIILVKLFLFVSISLRVCSG